MPNSTPTSATPLKDTFSATITGSPDSAETSSLRVIGQVDVPSIGWSLDLKPAAQNSGATTLTLDLVATPPASAEAISVKVGVRFDQSPPAAAYTEVEIRSGSDSFTVPVQSFQELIAARVQETEAVAMSAVAALKL